MDPPDRRPSICIWGRAGGRWGEWGERGGREKRKIGGAERDCAHSLQVEKKYHCLEFNNHHVPANMMQTVIANTVGSFVAAFTPK